MRVKRIIHVSDTHGPIPELPPKREGDVVVHSGDMMPNFYPGPNVPRDVYAVLQVEKQPVWLAGQVPHLLRQLDGRTLLYCAGNHDYFRHVEGVLRPHGVDVVDVTDQTVVWGGLRWRGFPWIPYIYGTWMYERQYPAMVEAVFDLHAALRATKGVDVLVSHAPPSGVLDYCKGVRYGNSVLRNYLAGYLRTDLGEPPHRPRVVLSGHVHEDGGVDYDWDGIVVSNAASKTFDRVNVLELLPDGTVVPA